MALDTPVLSVVNNQDGTGTFTVTGSTPGVTNDIRLTTLQAPYAWTTLTNFVGDGSDTVAVNPGFYWFTVTSSAPSESSIGLPVAACITAADVSILEQVMLAVVAKLKAGADANAFGSDIDNTKIQRIDVIDESLIERLTCGLPCIIVTAGNTETLEEETNASTDLVYPVYVGIYDAKMSSEDANNPLYFLWREAVRQLFHVKHLPGIARSVTTRVQPLQILDHKDSGENMFGFSSNLQILCTVRELNWS